MLTDLQIVENIKSYYNKCVLECMLMGCSNDIFKIGELLGKSIEEINKDIVMARKEYYK